ncbi:MAG: hypothetical protein ABSB42_04565 [Tepidisphaeraceae bacterium]|jgi:hypothetical protein
MPIQTATHFWIEAGQMSGDPNHRHQIEFSNDLAEFFDNNSRDAEVVTVRLPDGSQHFRPLTYRGTDYGQWTEQWRLGLPTVNMGGPAYAGRVILFRRVATGAGHIYDLEVEDVGSPAALDWQNQAQAHGRVGVTAVHDGRNFGWW